LTRAVLLACLLLFLSTGCVSALKEPPTLEELGQRVAGGGSGNVERLLNDAESAYRHRTLKSVRRAADLWLRAAVAESERTEGWIGATRALVWLADHLEDREERKAFASSSVDTGQWCRRASGESSECRYWLAVALGIQARERRATGIDALPRMVELLEAAAAGDPGLEHGGPSRVLALVYVRAPGWPTGPGDPDLAFEHAERAVALDPDYAPNQLALAEALEAIEERARSRDTYERALGLARSAVERGDPDAAEWVEEAELALAKIDKRKAR
jgi:tetratricopeptide (TPR) repeat protein